MREILQGIGRKPKGQEEETIKRQKKRRKGLKHDEIRVLYIILSVPPANVEKSIYNRDREKEQQP